MSEYGNETATAALRLSEKGLEAILALMKYAMDKEERTLKKENIKRLKEDAKAQRVSRELNRKNGYVNMKRLQKSGEDITAFGVNMDNEQLKRFSYLAKRYNIVFSSLSEVDKEGQKWHTVFVRNRDMNTCKTITDMMQKEFLLREELAENQNRQEAILEKGEKNLSPEDREKLEALRKERKNILKKTLYNANNEESEALLNRDVFSTFSSFEELADYKKTSSMGFEEALNHFTDSDYARDEPYFLCERTNPTSYIKLNTDRAMFRGNEYSRTQYNVYKDGKEQHLEKPLEGREDMLLTDERFEGRPQYYWFHLKNTMKKMGGFSDDVILFQSKEELERYQAFFHEQQKELESINGMKEISEEDIQNIQAALESQLDDIGIQIDDGGKPIDVQTGQDVHEILEDNLTLEERSKYAEGLIISQQMELYEQIAETYIGYESTKYLVGEAADQTLRMDNEQKSLKLKEKLSKLLKRGDDLKAARSTINSVQALCDVQEEYLQSEYTLEISDGIENTAKDEKKMNMQEWKEEVEAAKETMAANEGKEMSLSAHRSFDMERENITKGRRESL